MILKEIKRIEAEALKCLMYPLGQSKKISFDGVFGYDTEYSEKGVISIQLSCFKDGEVRSNCFFVPEGWRFSSQFLYQCIMYMNKWYELPYKQTYYLVAHFSQADISNLTDFDFINIVKNPKTSLMEVSGTYIGTLAPDKTHEIKIYDTFAYFKTSLARIGEILGFPKLHVSDDPEKEQWYKENMHELLKDNRELFIQYANRDAEITLAAYKKLMEVAANYNIDLKRYPTAPSLALAIFRSNFLETPTDNYKEVELETNGKKQTRLYYAGNKRIRMLALKSYWGGRNEAYRYGIVKFEQPIMNVYDVVSLYPSATRLQPLPNAHTKWEDLTNRANWQDYEGFLSVEFEFTENEKYPCLPVHDGKYLIFSRKGISHCTIAEARQAVEQGAKINIVGGYGFIPTKNEINHDLKKYMEYWMNKKANINKKKDPFMYEFSKLMMNALIGKFVQRKKVTDMIKVSQEYGLPIPELVNLKDRRLESIVANNTEIILGSGFSPEWASLILGKARAIISNIIYANKPLMAITDSILIDKPLVRSSALDELETIKSGLDCETPNGVDVAYIMRLRCYFLYNNQNMIKHAVGGLGVSKKDSDFLEEVSHYVFNEIPLPKQVQKKSLTKFKESYRKKDATWNGEIYRDYEPHYQPDKKRIIDENGESEPIAESWGNFETLKISQIINKSKQKHDKLLEEKEKILLRIKKQSKLLLSVKDEN